MVKERYLAGRDFVETRQRADSGSRTPGEALVINRQVWENSTAEGVRQGLFGLGELDEEGRPRCLYFREEPSVSLAGREVLICAEICQAQRTAQAEGITYTPEPATQPVAEPLLRPSFASTTPSAPSS